MGQNVDKNPKAWKGSQQYRSDKTLAIKNSILWGLYSYSTSWSVGIIIRRLHTGGGGGNDIIPYRMGREG